MKFDLNNKRILIAGHEGMVGQALCRRLSGEGCEVVTVARNDLDYRDQEAVKNWLQYQNLDGVVIAAAKVGGIMANVENPASFFYDNIMISTNIINGAYEAGVSKLLFLGSSCIYPQECRQPITEDMLLTSALEPTNEAYALAKISGLKMAQFYRTQYGSDFISAMPCNLFGVGDSYDEEGSHVIPALIMKAHKAKTEGESALTLWGSGTPLREFLNVDDLADGLVFLLQNYSDIQHINIGAGQEISIKKLAEIICDIVGFRGEICFDNSHPDGTLRKIMDITNIKNLGWYPPVLNGSSNDYQSYLIRSIKQSYEDYLKRYPQ